MVFYVRKDVKGGEELMIDYKPKRTGAMESLFVMLGGLSNLPCIDFGVVFCEVQR